MVQQDLVLALDKLAIYDVISRFCEAIDRADYVAAASYFTADCITDYGPHRGGEIVGRDAFLARIDKNQRTYKRTHHQLGQMIADVAGDRASTITYLDAAHER